MQIESKELFAQRNGVIGKELTLIFDRTQMTLIVMIDADFLSFLISV